MALIVHASGGLAHHRGVAVDRDGGGVAIAGSFVDGGGVGQRVIVLAVTCIISRVAGAGEIFGVYPLRVSAVSAPDFTGQVVIVHGDGGVDFGRVLELEVLVFQKRCQSG